MKKIIYLLFLITCSTNSYSQVLSFYELKGLFTKNISDVQDFLLKKDFELFESKEDNGCSTYEFAYQISRNKNKSLAFIYHTECELHRNILQTYGSPNKKDFLKLKSDAKANGLKYIESGITDGGAAMDIFKNNQFVLKTYTSRGDDGLFLYFAKLEEIPKTIPKNIEIDLSNLNLLQEQINRILPIISSISEKENIRILLNIYCNPASDEVHKKQYDIINAVREDILIGTGIEGYKLDFSIIHPDDFSQNLLDKLEINFIDDASLDFKAQRKLTSKTINTKCKENEGKCEFIQPVSEEFLKKHKLRYPRISDYEKKGGMECWRSQKSCNDFFVEGYFNSDSKKDFFLLLISLEDMSFSYYFFLSNGEYFDIIRAQEGDNKTHWNYYYLEKVTKGNSLADLARSNTPDIYLGFEKLPNDAVLIQKSETSISYIYFWDDKKEEINYFYTGARY